MSAIDYKSLKLSHIRVALDQGVLVVVLDRAHARNTFADAFAEEFIKVLDYADRDDRVRVVVFTADHTAPAYCSGADLSAGWHWDTSNPDANTDHGFRDPGGLVSLAVLRCRKVTIAAVNGHAVGVGVTALQLPFDFRFAWADAKIALPFVRRAVTPEATSVFLLPHLLGYSAAKALFLSGQTFSPTHPLLSRLYFAVYPNREDVFPAASAFAKELASNTSAVSIAATKAMLVHPPSNPEEAHLIDSYMLKRMTSGEGNDLLEGSKSFKEKRTPKFTDTVDLMKNWAPWWKSLNVAPGSAKL